MSIATGPVLLAVDLGADSGRVVAGGWDGTRLSTDVVHRFPNGARQHAGALRWHLNGLQTGIAAGLARAAERYGERIRSVGVCTWGVDYVLLDDDGQPLADPVCYRDGRTDGAVARAPLTPEALWQTTGIRSLPFNTGYQLLAESPSQLAQAGQLLTMPDYLHYWLSGVASQEWTNASTTQLAAPRGDGWHAGVIEACGLPPALFQPLTHSGTNLGPVQPALAAAVGLPDDVRVVVPAGHDTACAVAAVPDAIGDGAWLSCGTWSLLGCTQPQPVLSAAAAAGGWSNELAWDGQTRVLRNIMGLWVLQEARRALVADGEEYTWADLEQLARAVARPCTPLAVDDARFFTPGTAEDPYLTRISHWYHERGEIAPRSAGEIARAIIDGLAEAYAAALADLRTLTGAALPALHIVGGGSRNRLLLERTAQVCGCPVIAGPAEATAMGNLLIQLVGLGELNAEQLPQAAVASAEPTTVNVTTAV